MTFPDQRPPARVAPAPAEAAGEAAWPERSWLPAEDTVQARLEAGEVVVRRDLRFEGAGAEPQRLATAGVAGAKNVSFNPATGVLKGAAGDAAEQAWLTSMLEAYAKWSHAVVCELLPAYAGRLEFGKTSFRPRTADHAVSPRKDDRRLHVDAFPSQPVQGRRILRVFHNVNPFGEPRVWQVGEPFADFAVRFLPRVWARRRRAAPGWLLQAAGLTKGRRTAYDALMLGLHDAAKADDAYQANAPRRTLTFPPGATWLVFTDAAPHAALSGRIALEQTFLLPVAAMADPDASPLKILEQMTARQLV